MLVQQQPGLQELVLSQPDSAGAGSTKATDPGLGSFTAPCASPRSAMKTGANPGFISGVLYDSGLPTVKILELKMDTVLESFRDSVFGAGQGHGSRCDVHAGHTLRLVLHKVTYGLVGICMVLTGDRVWHNQGRL